MTIVNSGHSTAKIIPTVNIFSNENSSRNSLLTIKGHSLSIPAGSKRTVTLSANWIAPELWDINHPTQYRAQVSLDSGSQTIDKISQLFGFKEFEIRGRDFFLNGKRIVLLRNSTLSKTENFQKTAGKPYNTARLHLGFIGSKALDAADSIGLMIIPESSWNWVKHFPSAKNAVWWPNVKEYYIRMIKLHRNRPSIIMWSLCNETYWDNRRPADMKMAAKILNLVKQLDPTRPLQGDGEASWNGMLPTINIHYPETTAGPVRKKYPNSGLVIPNDLQWLKQKGVNDSAWRANFVWDRPLMIGEYWHAGSTIEAISSFTGDAAFDWVKWRYQDLKNTQTLPGNKYIEALRMASDYYRAVGVACLNPWSGNRNYVFNAVEARPLDFHPNFFSGKTGTRKMVIFNDSREYYYGMQLQCSLTVNGIMLWTETIKCPVKAGANKKLDLRIKMPRVSKITPAKLSMRLQYWRAGGFRELSRFEETIFIIPPSGLTNISTKAIALFDRSGKTVTALGISGMKLQGLKNLNTKLLANKKLLIISNTGELSENDRKIIDKFAVNGGRVLVLNQDNNRSIIAELPETDPEHVASKAWRRSFGTGLFTNIDERQLRYWKPDNIVSRHNFRKPSNGNFTIFLDCGGRYGMEWSPLLAFRRGKGEYIMSQLLLCEKLASEPLAKYMLVDLIQYALSNSLKPLAPVTVYAGNNSELKAVLETCNVVTTQQASTASLILVDGSAKLNDTKLEILRNQLSSGKTVWLHNFTPETISKIATLIPFKLQLAKPDATVQSAARRNHAPIINSLASFDFFWTKINLNSRKDYFQDGKPTAKLGNYVLAEAPFDATEQLMAPGFMVKIPVSAGTILFDTLAWDRAFKRESTKVSRIVSAITTNCGGLIKTIAEKRYNYFFVDLKKFANMGYYDQIEGDGKGGWTDQGANDMRFFIINHTGRAGGKEDGMPVGIESFPETVKLGKHPYKLIDPKINNNNSVLSFRGGEHGATLLEQVKDIPVNHKAEKLWFLHSACWTPGNNRLVVAKYLIHYADSTTETIPIVNGLDVGDWWRPEPLPHAELAWSGHNLKHSGLGLWSLGWDNPYPEKSIKSISVIGNLTQTQFILLGITAGITDDIAGGAGSDEKVIAAWNLNSFHSKTVKNLIASAPALKAWKKAPVPAQVPGISGLRFQHGQQLSCEKLKQLHPGEPFQLNISIYPEAKPDGYYGGILQWMSYRKNGFRLQLRKVDMKVHVTIFTKPGKPIYLTSKRSLQLNSVYQIKLVFDNKRSMLYINGKLENVVAGGLPAYCSRKLQFGVSSGKDYNFNGLIGKVSFSVKKPQ